MRKFLFENSFDEGEKDPRSLMILSDTEKETLRKEGFESGYTRGFHEGVTAGVEQKESFFVESVSKILETVTYHCDELEHQRYALAHLASHMTTDILQKLFPTFVEKIGKIEAERFVENILREEKPADVKIIAHPEICRFLQEKFLRNSKNLMQFEPDPSYTVGDVKMVWQDRGAERIQKKILEECTHLLQHLHADTEPDFSQDLKTYTAQKETLNDSLHARL